MRICAWGVSSKCFYIAVSSVEACRAFINHTTSAAMSVTLKKGLSRRVTISSIPKHMFEFGWIRGSLYFLLNVLKGAGILVRHPRFWMLVNLFQGGPFGRSCRLVLSTNITLCHVNIRRILLIISSPCLAPV